MHDQSPTDQISPPSYLITNLAKPVLSALHDGSGTSWRITGVPALPVVPVWLIKEKRIVLLPNCGHHDKHTAVIQSSYLSVLIECDDQVDVNHDPTQPSDAERQVYGWILATQKARERWIQNVVDLTSSEYPPGVEQACRDHTHTRGWKEELDEKVLIRDISVSTFSEPNLANPTSYEFQQALSDIRSRFWQSYVILYLFFHTDHASEGVQTTLGSKEEDLLDALSLAMNSPKTPARPKHQRAQRTSLLRALFTLAGGAVDHLHEVSGRYTTNENRNLLGSILGTTGSSDFENYDADEMRQRLSESPMFSDVTLSVQNLEHLVTQIRGCLYLGYPPDHLHLPSQVLLGLSTEQVKVFTTFLAYTYQQIPALNQSKNNILMLLIWGQQMGHQNHEALQQWIDSDDAWELCQGLIQNLQAEQPLEQLVIIIAALMSLHRLRPDHDDDRTEPVYQSFLGDMHACVTGLPLGHSGKVMETMMFPLIRVVREKHFEDLAIFLATALDREQPSLHLLDGLSDEYFRWRMTGLSHASAMKIVDAELFAMQLCPSFDSFAVGTDQTREVSRRIDSLASPNPASCQDPTSDCYKLVRVNGVSTTDGEVLVSSLDDNFKDLEIPSVERLSDGSWEIVVLKTTVPHAVNEIRGRLPASEIDLAYNPLQPTTKDLDEWTYVNAAELNWQWFVERALRVIKKGTMDNRVTLAARIYTYHLKILIPGLDLDQHP